MPLNILFLGDIVGKPGREVVTEHLPRLREQLNLDFVVAQGENLSGGHGFSAETLAEMSRAGVDVFTLGNHIFDKKDYQTLLPSDRKLVRPANYPPGTPGEGARMFTLPGGARICVVNLMGRIFMPQGLDCPFQFSRAFMRENRPGNDYDALLLDIHAETTTEKACLGHIWDGRASLVVGTHTHIPTADTRILPKGTGFQTDAGMCGFYDSSIGSTFDTSLKRFEVTGKPGMLQVATGPATMCGVYIEVGEGARCIAIRPVRVGGVLTPTE